MKRILLSLYISLVVCMTGAVAQDAQSAFQFLQIPVSAHAGALGGDNVTTIDDDLSMVFHNPALLSNTSHNQLYVGYTSYMLHSNVANAAYGREINERSLWGVGAHYLDFGRMKGADDTGNLTGSFGAKDMCLMGFYSFDFDHHWSGGVTAKCIYSNYEHAWGMALAVDLGLNYYLAEQDLSVSVVARNLGGQVKRFEDTQERIPMDILVGVSKGFAHAPIALSITFNHLTKWRKKDFYNGLHDNWGTMLLKHMVLGIDLYPTDNTYIALGYNHLLRSQLKADGHRGMEGFTLGAGIHVKRVKVGVAYGQYHVAAASVFANLSIEL